MSHNAILYATKPLLAIWTRLLPKIIFGRSSSMVVLAIGATTLAGGLGVSIYSAYLDLRYMWIEHKLARTAELLAKVEAIRAAADRRYEFLEKLTSRSRQMTVEIERLQTKRMELVRVLDFNQLPTACAVTDDENPAFEGYDVVLQKKETMGKILELVALERHWNAEMEWWHKEAEPEFKRRMAAQSSMQHRTISEKC
ncbi:hypothetical protein F5879DRAFT_938106 [Lentinula edodes]|nr:hypothetical protein F5879DRAFT_938106 [Lentinula edodes]